MSSEVKSDSASGQTDGCHCSLEVSVVIPCLDEAETLESCIRKAQHSLQAAGLAGEIIVADNGSRDNSVGIAQRLGARVVQVPDRGYGNALMGGIAAAEGEFIVMGDADDSYDFAETSRFVEKLREGYELVQGCRLPSGGGTVLPGAMPFLHRWIGNPLLSQLARLMFGVPVHDVYCGMRGFRKSLYQRLNQRCRGMEFAPEMIIKSRMVGASIAEVPITLHPDGRKLRRSHLRTFRDGWRTLRFFMIYSPRWAFFLPGTLLILLGGLGYALAMPGFTISGATLDAHTLLFATAWILMGYQAILFALLARIYAVNAGMLPTNRSTRLIQRVATLERVLLFSCLVFLAGLAMLGGAVYQWWQADFGPLDYAHTMRWVIPGVLSTVLGFQSVLAAFFLSIIGMNRQGGEPE